MQLYHLVTAQSVHDIHNLGIYQHLRRVMSHQVACEPFSDNKLRMRRLIR